MEAKEILQIIGVILGLVYLYLEYKANIWVWVIGMIMPMVHSILYYKSGLYADCGMQVYYILAGLYGLFSWLRGKESKSFYTISHTPKEWYASLLVIYCVLHAAIYLFLTYFTNSTVPFWDSMTTALSAIGLWLLSRKKVEQWGVWIIVDFITVILYIYKGIPLTGCLYMVYTCLAFTGYRRWIRIADSSER